MSDLRELANRLARDYPAIANQTTAVLELPIDVSTLKVIHAALEGAASRLAEVERDRDAAKSSRDDWRQRFKDEVSDRAAERAKVQRLVEAARETCRPSHIPEARVSLPYARLLAALQEWGKG